MPLNQSQLESIKLKLHEFIGYLNRSIIEHDDIAAKFHDEENAERFFHDGNVAKASRIKVDFKMLFTDELKLKGEGDD